MFTNFTFRRQLVDKALYLEQKKLVGRVLDLGGGRTRGKFPIGNTLGWVVLDENAAFKPTIVGDAQNLPFKKNSFNAVKSSELFGYLFEPFEALKEIVRILKPGGYAVITCPFLTPFDDDQHDCVRLTSSWWKIAAKKLKVELQTVGYQGYFFTVLGDFLEYWITHWPIGIRHLAYITIFPWIRLTVKLESILLKSNYLKRFTTGFYIILKK